MSQPVFSVQLIVNVTEYFTFDPQNTSQTGVEVSASACGPEDVGLYLAKVHFLNK